MSIRVDPRRSASIRVDPRLNCPSPTRHSHFPKIRYTLVSRERFMSTIQIVAGVLAVVLLVIVVLRRKGKKKVEEDDF
jgi:hypothetical protein